MKHSWARTGVLCLALVTVGVGAPRFAKQSRAQNAAPTYQTSEEAAKAFMTFLSEEANLVTDYSYDDYEIDNSGHSEILNMISRDSLQKLENDVVRDILRNMVEDLKRPVWQAKSQSTADEKIAIVKVIPNSSAAREVICIKEGSVWRVDLLATYANWLKLDKSDVEDIIARAGENTRRRSCQSNLKQIALGLKQYLQDNDERYPPAKQWHDAIMPYTQTEEIFRCPSIPSGKNGYAMNWKLSKKSESVVESADIMALIYESTTLKINHSGEGRDMAFRHLGGINMAFVDGHVKWISRSRKNTLITYFNFKSGN